MPKVRFKAMVVEIQGTMYDVVFKKSPKGKIIVTKRPDMSKVRWSKAQKNQRTTFTLANDYAKAAMVDPDKRAVYEAAAVKQHRQPYRVAFSDYFKGQELLAKAKQSSHSQKRKRRDPAKS